MPDPFLALHAPVVAVDPAPAFAAQLKARVARALGLPKGVTVSDLSLDHETTAPPRTQSEVDLIRQGDIGYVSLWVPDVERAAAFFGAVLGWTYQPAGSGQGRMVAGVEPSHGLHGGHERSTLFLCFMVDDIDGARGRVHAAGGSAGEPTTERYGRICNCVDDQGTEFALYQPPAGQPEPRPLENGSNRGDLGYVTMQVLDSAKARAFYGAVLGWHFTPGRVDDGWGVEGIMPMTGMHGGNEQATTLPLYRVDDIETAISLIRTEGGIAPEPERQPYGLSALCTDDQGTQFYVWQP